MTAALYAVDPYRKNAYSDHVSFDMGYKSTSIAKIKVGPADNTERAVEEYNPEVSIQKTPTQTWEMDVRSLVNSKKWLSQYGLRRSKLTLYQILPVIGFKVSDDFDRSLKRPISSRYADGLFHQICRPDGKTFNITCSREQLRNIEARLNQSMHLFRRRLEWLTTESRRLFGVIEEKAVTIVLDIRNMSPIHFDQYRMALERVIYEQLTQLSKFNLVRSTDDIERYQSECVPVTHDTIQGAVDWVWALDRLAPVAKTTTCEAIQKASMDPNNEAIYLFTEGTAIETCKEILKEKVKDLHHKVPVHIVVFNCDDSATIRFLKDFTQRTSAKFHAYSVIMEMDSYEPSPIEPRNNRANIVLKKRTFGGVPPGAGMREDVALLFEEIEETRNTIAQVQAIMEEVPEPKIQVESVIDKTDLTERDEQYMGTKQWLSIYGLGARRLELWDVLGSVAFKHRDGVVDLKVKPENGDQTEAVTHTKLINARYCERFPVVKWKDGQVMHVQVTPEIHRRYERKMNISLKSFQQRIDWLKQGSRALFGTVIEDQIYVLIDTSASMLPSISFLKDRLFVLMQEQLRHKKKFNMVAFNSKAISWQNRMVDVTEQTLIGAWKWVQNLSCWGSTNTYAALQHALSDPGTQAIYLLTDGRPDQPPKSIVAQVQMQHCVPVHAISFNCNDTEANQFLFDLAQATDGRYHYFSEKGVDAEQPKSWESEDIRLLKEEIRRGLENLQKIEELRDECSNLSWKSEIEFMKERRCSRDHALPNTDRPSAVPAMDPSEIFRPDPLNIPRPKSAPPPREREAPSPPPRSASPPVQKSSIRIRKYSRPVSARKSSTHPLSASHTRTSLLRTMTSTGRFDPNEWLLPETRHLFEKQAKHQQQLAEVDQKREKARTFRKKRFERAKETSSKIWLSKHGLVAKKLTILDALAPTFIPRRAKYVPILDRHVLSKVFDEILPMAHVSSRKPHMTLINPTAVDLPAYEKRVTKAIKSFQKRLNKIVWDALPVDERKKFDSDKPVQFEENRNEILDILDNAGWPIKENDIILLEEEIARANNFLQQSRDLRRASDPRRKDSYDNLLERVMDMDDKKSSSSSSSSDSESDDSKSVHSDKGNKSTRSDKSDKDVKDDKSDKDEKSDRGDRSVRSDRSKDRKEDDDLNVYDDKASIASSLTDKSTHDFFEHCQILIRKVHSKIHYYNTIKKMEMQEKLEKFHLKNHYKDFILQYYDEINQNGGDAGKALKYKSESSGSLSHVVKGQSDKMEKIQFNPAIIRKVLDTLKGQSVIARNDKDGFYYPGTVVRCPDPRHAVIKFEPKEERTVPTRLVIATSGAIPCPLLRAGDYVLVRVQYTNAKSDCYVPGIVQVVPVREEVSNKFYTVLMFNGQQATTCRNFLMKISKSRFEFAIRYIADIQNVDSQQYEKKVYVTPRTPRTPRPSDKEKRTRQDSSKEKEDRNRSESSRSRSRSSSRSRSHSYSPKQSRSRSHSRSTSRSRSQSHSRSESRSNSSRSRTPSPVEHKYTNKKKISRSRSRYSSRSSSESRSTLINVQKSRSEKVKSPIERPVTPVLGQHEEEEQKRKQEKEKKRKQKLKELKRLLIKQQEEQEQQQLLLKQQRKKMKRLKKKLKKKKRQARSSERFVTDGPSIQVESSSQSDSDDDDSRHPSNDNETSNDQTKIPSLLLLRKSLPRLREGEEVLARWTDEGWYFRGIVKEDCGDYSYIVEDATHQFEKIWREDIITDYDDANQILQPKDTVVALHPHYSFSYAPGVILEVYHNMWMKVRLYDGEETKIPREEAFKLTTEKFEHDVNYIVECETRWVGQAVVARDDRYGTYHLASVKKRIGNGREYLLEWCDGSLSQQNSIHIFGVYTKHHRLAVGDHVLAMMDEQQHMYLPGWIAGIVGEKINIKFCEGSIKDVDDVLQCFWLSNDYYDNAVQFFSKCQDVEADDATTNNEEF